MRVALIGLIGLVLLGGLGYWVANSATSSLDFRRPFDPNRELPQVGFYVGEYPTVSHFNPFTTSQSVTLSHVLRYTHDCLMRLDVETRKLEPALARVVESSADGLSYTFKLRDDASFSDGASVTVDDVRFTFDVVSDNSVTAGSIHDSVMKIATFTTLDDRRFKIVLRERHFNGLASMAVGYRIVQRKWFMDQIAVAARKLDIAVPEGPGSAGFGALLNEIRLPGPGTGPYMIARDYQNRPVWTENRHLWLVQHVDSWHRRAFPRRWNLRGFGLRFEGRSRLTQLKRQQIDWDLPTNPRELLKAHPDVKENYDVLTYDSAVAGHYAISWNCERLPVAVRLALAMLFNRKSIRDDILAGGATLVDSCFRQSDPEHPKDPRPIVFDVKEARRRLEKAGYGPDGKRLEIRIIAVAGYEQIRQILDDATSTFGKAGVTLHVDLMEQKAALDEINKKTDRQFDGSLSYWTHPALSIDPHVFFHSEGALNDGRYSNAKVDDLLVRARTTVDITERAKLYHEFHDIVRDEQPMTMLVHPINTLLLHRRFKNVKTGWGGAVPAYWWVEPGDQIHFTGRSR